MSSVVDKYKEPKCGQPCILGPNQHPFDSFQQACKFHTEKYCPITGVNTLTGGLVLPSIMDIGYPELLNEDVIEKHPDKVCFRKRDEAELALHRSLQALAHTNSHIFVALHKFEIDEGRIKMMYQAFGDDMAKLQRFYNEEHFLDQRQNVPQLTVERSNCGMSEVFPHVDMRFEADAIMIHRNSGVIMFECKATDSLNITKAYKQLHRCRLFIKSVVRVFCSRSDVACHKVIVLPNLDKAPTPSRDVHFITQKNFDTGNAVPWLHNLLNGEVEATETASVFRPLMEVLLGIYSLSRAPSNTITIDPNKLAGLRAIIETGERLNRQDIAARVGKHKQAKLRRTGSNKSNEGFDLLLGSKLVKSEHQPIGLHRVVLLSPQQIKILKIKRMHMVIAGPAGSGKTYCLQAKISQTIQNENDADKITVVGSSESLHRTLSTLKSSGLDTSRVTLLESARFADAVYDLLKKHRNDFDDSETIFALVDAARSSEKEFIRLMNTSVDNLIEQFRKYKMFKLYEVFGHLFVDDAVNYLYHSFAAFVGFALYRYHCLGHNYCVVLDGNQNMTGVMPIVRQTPLSGVPLCTSTAASQPAFLHIYNILMSQADRCVSSLNSVMRYTESVYSELYKISNNKYSYFHEQWQPTEPIEIAHRRQGIELLNVNLPVTELDSFEMTVEKAIKFVSVLVKDVPPECIAIIVKEATMAGDEQLYLYKDSSCLDLDELEYISDLISSLDLNIPCRIINGSVDPARNEMAEPAVTLLFDHCAYSCEWPVVIFIERGVAETEDEIVTRSPEQYLGKSRCTTFLISIYPYDDPNEEIDPFVFEDLYGEHSQHGTKTIYRMDSE